MIIDSLEKILEKEKSRILIDNSSINLTESFSDRDRFFLANSWEDIDAYELRSFIKLLNRYANALNSDNILILPEVISENGRFVRSFKGHKDMLKGIKSVHNSKTPRNTNRANRPLYKRQKINLDNLYEEDVGSTSRRRKSYMSKKEASEQEILYQEAIDYLNTIQHKLNSHVMAVHDPLCNDLIEIIKELNQSREIKTKSEGRGKYEYRDLYTDEKLIGTAFYLAFRDKEKVAIATSDFDIPNLLIDSFGMLSSATNGLGPRFKKKLLNNPVEVHNFPHHSNKNNENVIATTANLKTFRQTYEGIDMQKTQQLVYKLIKL